MLKTEFGIVEYFDNGEYVIDESIELIYIDEWLNHIEDEKPITARQCIKDVVMRAKYKPELIDVILEALENMRKYMMIVCRI